MWITMLLLLASAIATLAIFRAWRASAERSRPVPIRRPRAAPARQAAPSRQAASRAEKPAAREPLPWEGSPVPSTLGGDALAARMRDRYIAARFPGIAESAADLLQTENVIRAARLCFEEEKYHLAHELLHLAAQQSPGEEDVRLAQLEIAFLLRDKGRYGSLASDFRQHFPRSRNWAEVCRLGRAVCPQMELFAAIPGTHPNEHYGPWPDLPNWIQASWDLTAEVLAADFHRGMTRGAPDEDAVAPPRVAYGG